MNEELWLAEERMIDAKYNERNAEENETCKECGIGENEVLYDGMCLECVEARGLLEKYGLQP